MTQLRCTMILVALLLPGTLRAETSLQQFFAQNCVKCHGPNEQQGGVRLDKSVDTLLADVELLETITSLVEAGEMPPKDAPQPTAEAVAELSLIHI